MPRSDWISVAAFDILNMVNFLIRGILGRVVGYAGLVLGFWLLYKAFLSTFLMTGLLLGICGSGTILLALYVLVRIRRIPEPLVTSELGKTETEVTDDPINRSSSSD